MRELAEGARLLDRYSLIRRLGSGPGSVVWLADDRQSDSRMALKFLAGDNSPARCDAFAREWRIASRLMHPNIVRVFEYHDDADGPFYGIQYIGDTTIAAAAGGDPADTMRPVAMLADALRYAHGKGIVHRDVKAANVLLDGRGLPYLIDFGVAATAGSTQQGASGTPVAQSRQQAAGEAASASDDVFALGVLMHELLAGMPPQSGIADCLQDGSPMPAALSTLLASMLDSEAAARPDAEQVGRALRAAGFLPGPAPARFVGGREAASHVVESHQAPRTAAVSAPAAAALRSRSTERAGLPAGLIYGGLGLAVALLLLVVFVLPEFVGPEAPKSQDDSVVNATDATAAADSSPAGAGSGVVPATEDEAPLPLVRSDAAFGENLVSARGDKAATDEVLGDLLSRLERLRYRAVERWGGQDYLDMLNVYAEGDQAYVDRNYRLAGEKYRQTLAMLQPFFDRIDTVFAETLAAARDAFNAGDHDEAIRLYDLAVAITPGHREATAGLARAKNLQSVLALVEQGKAFEKDLALEPARQAFEKALELDPEWDPAVDGLQRVRAAILEFNFQQRMTEGFAALADGDFATARAAFNSARTLRPESSQPVDGLLQVDQEARLADIRRLETEAQALESDEQWESAAAIYQDILKIDGDLQFAKDGLAIARQRAAMYAQLAGYIDDPDSLSAPDTMQAATTLLLDLSRMGVEGPRLEDQKRELSRLLKRAATPLSVQLISDNLTEVAIFKVGLLGTFGNRELELRPGAYVAVGSRNGFRDVRVEFRVAPEIEMRPVVVRCEEPI